MVIRGEKLLESLSYPDAANLGFADVSDYHQCQLGLRATPVFAPFPEGRQGRQLVWTWLLLLIYLGLC